MSLHKVILRQGKESSLLRFHPWVFSGAIYRADQEIKEGEVVDVLDSENNFIARGHYQTGSIAVRVLSFEEHEIDNAFWEERITAAYTMRKKLGIVNASDNDTYRLIYGEGDNLPGLIVDIYGDSAVMQAHSIGMHYVRHTIADCLIKTVEGLKNIYYKSETTLPKKAPLEDSKEAEYLVGGASSAKPISTEYGLRFHIDWLRGQKTGFFVDQRENRALLERYSKGKNVLNMFCYTGGFSCYALRGGANKVCSVDSSAKAIELTNENVELNFGDEVRHESYAMDAFKFLEEMGNQYDLIILDPPAFAKHRGAIRNALQGYRRLNAKAFDKIKPGGILFTFSCSQVVDKEQFRLTVFSAAAQSKRKVRILHQLTQPADHPINIYHPEGEYLKGLVLYVE